MRMFLFSLILIVVSALSPCHLNLRHTIFSEQGHLTRLLGLLRSVPSTKYVPLPISTKELYVSYWKSPLSVQFIVQFNLGLYFFLINILSVFMQILVPLFPLAAMATNRDRVEDCIFSKGFKQGLDYPPSTLCKHSSSKKCLNLCAFLPSCIIS